MHLHDDYNQVNEISLHPLQCYINLAKSNNDSSFHHFAPMSTHVPTVLYSLLNIGGCLSFAVYMPCIITYHGTTSVHLDTCHFLFRHLWLEICISRKYKVFLIEQGAFFF